MKPGYRFYVDVFTGWWVAVLRCSAGGVPGWQLKHEVSGEYVWAPDDSLRPYLDRRAA